MIDWMIENKTWLFSGILIAIPLAILSLLIGTRSIRKTRQKQKSGSGSINIQVGGDLKLSDRENERKE